MVKKERFLYSGYGMVKKLRFLYFGYGMVTQQI